MKFGVTKADIIGAKDEKLTGVLGDAIDQLYFILNGNIDLLNNVKLEIHQLQFFRASQDYSMQHSLGRVANGYIVISNTQSAIIYNGIANWNPNAIFLRSSAPTIIKAIVF